MEHISCSRPILKRKSYYLEFAEYELLGGFGLYFVREEDNGEVNNPSEHFFYWFSKCPREQCIVTNEGTEAKRLRDFPKWRRDLRFSLDIS